jgi:hypothetical protein
LKEQTRVNNKRDKENMEHKIQNEKKQNTIQQSKLKGQTRVDDPRDKGSMEHKIQNEHKQNTIQQSNR